MFCASVVNKNDLLDSVLRNDPLEVIISQFCTTKVEDLSEDTTTKIALHAIANHQIQLFYIFSKCPLSKLNRHIAIQRAMNNHGPREKDLSQVISILLEQDFTYFKDAQGMYSSAREKGLTELADRIVADATLTGILEIINDPDRLDKTRSVRKLISAYNLLDGHYEQAAIAAAKMKLPVLASLLCKYIEDDTIRNDVKSLINPDTLLDKILFIIKDPGSTEIMKQVRNITSIGILLDKHYQEAAEAALERKLPTLAAWLRSHIRSDVISGEVDKQIKHSLIARHSSTSPSTISRDSSSPSSLATSAAVAAAAGQPSPTP